jgi:hypothetical protein
MDVESQPQANSREEGTDKKNEIEQVEPAIKKPRLAEQMATLDFWSPSSAKKEPKSLSSLVLKGGLASGHPQIDVESQLQADSGEEASDIKNEIEQVEPAIKKPRLAEQIESLRKSPVDEERKRKLATVDFFIQSCHHLMP